MAIFEKFYNNDRARNIRELLNQNFENVARYIPNNFLSLSPTERENLTDDYKTHFKLVFDTDVQRTYMWSNVKRNWEQYLLYAWDEFARTAADANADSAFVDAELGIDMNGNSDPYTITFYNREHETVSGAQGATPVVHPRTAKDSITLTGINIKFNDDYSVTTIIQKILDDFQSLDDFVGNRDDILANSDLTAKTICGAIKEINNKAIESKEQIDNILDGTTKVPEAIHSENADRAESAKMADDSMLLGGQPSEYYAKQSDLNNTNTLLEDTIKRVEVNESDISELKTKTDITDEKLKALDEREDEHYQDYLATKATVGDNSLRISELEETSEQLLYQIGWEILAE